MGQGGGRAGRHLVCKYLVVNALSNIKKVISGRKDWATWAKIMDSVKTFHVAVVLQIQCWCDLYVLWPTHFWPKKLLCIVLI